VERRKDRMDVSKEGGGVRKKGEKWRERSGRRRRWRWRLRGEEEGGWSRE
jgi:hypothetical protein